MDYTEHTEDVAVSRIIPLHEVRDAAKLKALTASLEANGWQGRPLLVVDDGCGNYFALTGSHRYAAAEAVGLETVPCVVLSPEGPVFVNYRNDVVEQHPAIEDGVRLVDDEERLAAFRRYGMDVAASLVADEIAAAESLQA